MYPLQQYEAAQALEQYLGDPENPDNTMSFKRAIETDESEEFPEAQMDLLHQWGSPLYYIPQEYGGKLTSYEEMFALIRVIARRDQSVAVSDMHTFLGALPIWLEGTQEQKQQFSEFIRRDGCKGTACLAVSEKARGSDLLATETQAVATENGYLLSGEKWPINKATLTKAMTVLAKTDDHGNTRSLSMFLVYKDELDSFTYSNLPKIKTLGLRSSDISGIQFNGSSLPKDANIGAIGTGLDLTLKGFFVTRTLCSFLSLGAADTALRTTLKLTHHRQLYGKTVFALPHAKRVMMNAFVDILIGDCTSISAARCLHVIPQQFSVLSAIAKSFVTKKMEDVLNDLSVIMGARFYLREEHCWGIFQKTFRDNGVISIFDGSSIVNLYALILQLRQLAKARHKIKDRPALASRLETIFTLDQELPPFTGNLELFSRGCNDIIQGLPLALERLQAWTETENSEVLEKTIALTHDLLEELEKQETILGSIPLEAHHEQSFESFELAKNYCKLHAAAACLQMWIYNRDRLSDFFAGGEWLVLCLDRLLSEFRPTKIAIPQDYFARVTAQMIELYETEKMLSIVPFQLATDGARENPIKTPELVGTR
jgi:alkylation response protein AidB-like acyl-CoA dehydrogenase